MVLKERKEYLFHIMVLKGKFLYVVWMSICTWMVTLGCKQFSGCLTQNVSNSGMIYQFVWVTGLCNWHELLLFHTIRHKSFNSVS